MNIKATEVKTILLFALTVALIAAGGCCSYPNLTTHKNHLVSYYKSGEYERSIESVASKAQNYIHNRAASGQTNLAVTLDIDDTALSDWSYMKAMDFGFDNGGFEEWINRADAPAIKPVLNLYHAAQKSGMKVFFITGRKEHLRSATQKNLEAAGYTGFSELFMRPDSGPKMTVQEFKTSIRHKLNERGYLIVANVGDQESDLAGGEAERAFKIANPFYLAN